VKWALELEAEFREDLYYEDTHAWLKVEGDLARIGVDDVAQRAAGRIIYVNPLRPGAHVLRGKPLVSLESRKWVGFVNAPITGVVVEVNEEVLRRPSLINEDPYGKGWIVLVKPSNLEEDLAHLRKGEEAREWFMNEVRKLLRKVT